MLNINRVLDSCEQMIHQHAPPLQKINGAIQDLSACLAQINLQQTHSVPQNKIQLIKENLNIKLNQINAIKSKLLQSETDRFLNQAKQFLGPHYNEQHIKQALAEITKLGDSFENHTAKFLTFAKENRLNVNALHPLDSDQSSLVCDIFLLTCLQPTQIVSTHPLKIQQISSFNFLDAEFLLKEKTILQRFMNQLDQKNYPNYSLTQRIFALNNAKIDLNETTKLHQTVFYQTLIKYVDLNRMLFQDMSSAQTQVYLNSCGPAAVNQEILLKISSLPALLAVSHKIEHDIETRIQFMPENIAKERIFRNSLGLGGVTRKPYIVKQLQKAKMALQKAEDHIQTLVISGKKISAKDLSIFFKNWNRAMQILASIYDPQDIIYLTKKPVQQHWLVSLLLMLIPGFIMGVFYRGSLTDRAEGVGTQHLKRLEQLSSYPQQWHLKINHTEFGRHASEKGVEELWQKLFEQGGSKLLLENHLLFVRAITIHGKKRFVLFEPKGNKSILYTLKRFQKFLKKNASEKVN